MVHRRLHSPHRLRVASVFRCPKDRKDQARPRCRHSPQAKVEVRIRVDPQPWSRHQSAPPVVGDPALQRFFIEIAGALNNLSTTPPIPGTPISAQQTPYLASPQQHSQEGSDPGKHVPGPADGGPNPSKAQMVDGYVNITMSDATPTKSGGAAGAPGKKGRRE